MSTSINTNKPRPLCICHDDTDGFCCAWLIWRCVYGDQAEYRAVEYGDKPHGFEGRDVIIADFSYPRATLIHMQRHTKSLLVFDHHKTAQKDCEGLKCATFDVTKCGARLVWEWIRRTGQHRCKLEHEPLILGYIEDRDLWKWELPHSREINAALTSYRKDFHVWNQLNEMDDVALQTEGRAIERFKLRAIEMAVARAVEIECDGHKVLVTNCTTPNCSSEVGHVLAKDRPFGMFYYIDGQVTVWGLRSTEHGLDVSEIAKNHGGGGHKHAAGFTTQNPFLALAAKNQQRKPQERVGASDQIVGARQRKSELAVQDVIKKHGAAVVIGG